MDLDSARARRTVGARLELYINYSSITASNKNKEKTDGVSRLPPRESTHHQICNGARYIGKLLTMYLSLKKGGTYILPEKAGDKNARACYHYTPGSYNSQKGMLLLQISSLDLSTVDFHSIQYPEENQKLQYAMKLSPNMSGMSIF